MGKEAMSMNMQNFTTQLNTVSNDTEKDFIEICEQWKREFTLGSSPTQKRKNI